MKDILKEITKRTFVWLLVLSMGMLIANKAIFFHEHRMADGTIVAHAHPYDKSDEPEPFKTHHHSKSEFFFLSHIDTLFVLAILAFAILRISAKPYFQIFLPKYYFPVLILNQKGRAPPLV